MLRSPIRILLLVLVFPVFVSFPSLVAQDKKAPQDVKEAIKELLAKAENEYRTFFKKPEQVVEFWAAISFEITLGKFDVAGLHLDQMLKKEPKADTDQKLLEIEEAEGMAVFLRLQQIRTEHWSNHADLQKLAMDNVALLIQRVTDALDKRLGDPVRINKFIKNLGAKTREERAFALMQLERSQERAGPYLVEALRSTTGSVQHQRIQEAILKLDRSAIPPMLEVLKAANAKDYQDVDLRLALLDIVRRRDDKRAVPYLWHLSSAPKYPPLVRAKAKETLASLLETPAELLPPAKVVLTQMAEKYYQHKELFRERFRGDQKDAGQLSKLIGVRFWPWNGKEVQVKPEFLTASEAEFYFANRYAKEALDLDPAYQPAQNVYLSLRLEREFQEPLDQFLFPKAPSPTQQLLATLDAELLTTVLERALTEHNPAVILPLVQTLGERGEIRAARPSGSGVAGVLVRALNYADRRVQYAAVRALLRMPSSPAPVAATRTVEVLRRFLAADAAPKALLAFVAGDQAPELRHAVKDAGFTAVVAANLKETQDKLRDADIDVILLNHTVAPNELPFVISQLRADSDAGLLPLLLLTPPKREGELSRVAQRHRNIAMLPEVLAKDPAELKKQMEEAIKFAAVSDTIVRAAPEQRTWLDEDVRKSKGQKLSDPERKQLRQGAMDYLWRMARGEIAGYEVRLAEPAIVQALRTDELAVPALEILSRFPGSNPQQRLAAFVLDPGRGKLRITAAMELNRHLQKHGLGLNKDQLGKLQEVHNNPNEDATLRTQVALVIGSLRSTPQQTGERLLNPPKSAPPKN